jgi:hypothetical protein
VVSVDVGERTKPVVLHLKEPIRMVERLREAQERHGPEGRSRAQAGAERRRAGGGHQSIVPAPHGGANSTARTSSDAAVALSFGALVFARRFQSAVQ